MIYREFVALFLCRFSVRLNSYFLKNGKKYKNITYPLHF